MVIFHTKDIFRYGQNSKNERLKIAQIYMLLTNNVIMDEINAINDV